ncbi:MAG: hypothetical protein Q9160_004962 [Pyrenula sp. 1 TL-2023]
MDMVGAVTVTVRVPEPLGLALGIGMVVPFMGMVVLKVPELIGGIGAVAVIVNDGPEPKGAVPFTGKVGNTPEAEPFPKGTEGVRPACLFGGMR